MGWQPAARHLLRWSKLGWTGYVLLEPARWGRGGRGGRRVLQKSRCCAASSCGFPAARCGWAPLDGGSQTQLEFSIAEVVKLRGVELEPRLSRGHSSRGPVPSRISADSPRSEFIPPFAFSDPGFPADASGSGSVGACFQRRAASSVALCVVAVLRRAGRSL